MTKEVPNMFTDKMSYLKMTLSSKYVYICALSFKD